MSNTPIEQIVAAGAEAEAAARARDAADAAVAEAAMRGEDAGGSHFAEPTGATTVTDDTPPATQRNLTIPARPADEGGIRDDNFGLDPNIGDMLAEALDRKFNADTAATPAPAPDPGESAAPTAGEGAGGGGADEDAAAASPPAPAPDTFVLDDYARDYFGTNLTREQAAHLFSILDNLNGASPEQRQQIDAILAGRAIPQITGGPPAPPEGTGQAPGQVSLTPQQVGLPARPGDHDPEGQHVYDTLIAPTYQAIIAQQEALRADIAATTATQQQQIQQQQAARIDTAVQSWRSGKVTEDGKGILSDGEFDALQAKVVRSQIFPSLLNSMHGNVEQAVNAAFDQMFWADPTFRDRAMANAASGRDPLTGSPDPANPQAQAAASTAEGRKALAASVAGGGGSTVSRTPPAPRTKSERHAAMVGELAAAMESAE